MSLLSSLFGRSALETVPSPRVLLIGTATTVRQLRHTLREAEQPLDIVGCCLLQPQHRTGAIGMPVLGTCDQLELTVRLHRIQLALVCLPTAMHAACQDVSRTLSRLGVTARILPTLADQLTGRTRQPAGTIDVADLLGRRAHRLDEAAIKRLLTGKRVMITGAGGSIGSELARIIARFEPADLQLMERAENNLFEIHRQIVGEHPDLSVTAILHDVTQAERTLSVCGKHEPQVIFHAAAHKHVPMMEDHPREAVINNLFGTAAIADAADAVGVERFVMISSDKAVNPTSVMGATKRLAELYIQDLNRRSATDYSMVRFGNVLGSACSVVPIWTDQLARGGPITVTDPRMTRYFMTIPEAAALVIQAATLDNTAGRVLLLDMGQPISIVEMARRFVRLHGLEPDRDVAIVFTGVRPGEKLFEELAYDGEAMQPTAHEAVRIWRTTPPDADHMRRMVARFDELRDSEDATAILGAIREAVPEMQPAAGRPHPASATGAELRQSTCFEAQPTDKKVLAG